jgi:hypothetical protein
LAAKIGKKRKEVVGRLVAVWRQCFLSPSSVRFFCH